MPRKHAFNIKITILVLLISLIHNNLFIYLMLYRLKKSKVQNIALLPEKSPFINHESKCINRIAYLRIIS